MISIYAISSLDHNYIYVRMTQNLEQRIARHNKGRERTTKPYMPYKLLYKEVSPNRAVARKRGIYWKSGVGKEQLRKIRDGLIK